MLALAWHDMPTIRSPVCTRGMWLRCTSLRPRSRNIRISINESIDQVLFSVGAIFGYVDYQLEERRAHSAIAASDAVVTVFTRAGLDRYCECCTTASAECCSTLGAQRLVVWCSQVSLNPCLSALDGGVLTANRAYVCVWGSRKFLRAWAYVLVGILLPLLRRCLPGKHSATGTGRPKRPTESCSRPSPPSTTHRRRKMGDSFVKSSFRDGIRGFCSKRGGRWEGELYRCIYLASPRSRWLVPGAAYGCMFLSPSAAPTFPRAVCSKFPRSRVPVVPTTIDPCPPPSPLVSPHA